MIRINENHSRIKLEDKDYEKNLPKLKNLFPIELSVKNGIRRLEIELEARK